MSEGSGGKVAVAAGGGILAIFAGMGRFADDCGKAAVRSGDDVWFKALETALEKELGRPS